MDLTISRCFQCGKTRLVDRVNGKTICLACKQKFRKIKQEMLEPIAA